MKQKQEKERHFILEKLFSWINLEKHFIFGDNCDIMSAGRIDGGRDSAGREAGFSGILKISFCVVKEIIKYRAAETVCKVKDGLPGLTIFGTGEYSQPSKKLPVGSKIYRKNNLFSGLCTHW